MSEITAFTKEEYTMFLKKIESVIKKDSNGCKYSPKRVYCTIKGMQKSTNVKTLLAKQAFRYKPRTQRLVPLCKEEKCVNMNHFKVEDINTLESRKKIFFNKCVVKEDTGCFLLGEENEYIQIGFMSRMELAHRVSYMLFKNNGLPIEKTNEKGERLVIRHLCSTKNRNCVNPEHLTIGTYKDNAEDEIKLVGVKRPNAKISEDTARLIKHSKRNKDESDYLTCKDRAKIFGVKVCVVRDIDCGSNWAHIEDRFGVVDLKKNSKDRENDIKRRKLNKDRVFTKEENDGIMEKLFNNMEEKYMSKDPEIKTKCHIWTGQTVGKEPREYGYTKYKGKEKRVHIFSCEAKYGRNREKHEVTRHLCGYNLCFNQDHLAFGTNGENTIDCIKTGRKGDKLDAEKVKTIFKRYMGGERNIQLLANEYGVKYDTIRNVVTRKSWKHVVLD